MDTNWIAFALAVVTGIAIGALWFGPRTFFPAWWKALGKTPDEQPGTANMGVVFGLTAIAVIVQAGVLSLLLPVIGTAVGSMGWFTGLATGVLLGLAFAAAPAITHKLFGGFRLWVWVLEAGQDIVSLAAMGAIIGAFS